MWKLVVFNIAALMLCGAYWAWYIDSPNYFDWSYLPSVKIEN